MLVLKIKEKRIGIINITKEICLIVAIESAIFRGSEKYSKDKLYIT